VTCHGLTEAKDHGWTKVGGESRQTVNEYWWGTAKRKNKGLTELRGFFKWTHQSKRSKNRMRTLNEGKDSGMNGTRAARGDELSYLANALKQRVGKRKGGQAALIIKKV